MLEDLIMTAMAEAQKASEEKMNEAIWQATGGFQLPF
jgi:DNA-binding protein YbaB